MLISTDKAVDPVNVLGATKRLAEMTCQSLADHRSTRFVTVRFGNVLDSAGSVVPLFREQIRRGGPVTVTDPEVTRFFMTIPEACQLIPQASAIGTHEAIYTLDMGEPVPIRLLAEQMIRLAGKQPGRDIAVVYTGLRPGEKLHETLFHADERYRPTAHPKILRGHNTLFPADVVWGEVTPLPGSRLIRGNARSQALPRRCSPGSRINSPTPILPRGGGGRRVPPSRLRESRSSRRLACRAGAWPSQEARRKRSTGRSRARWNAPPAPSS